MHYHWGGDVIFRDTLLPTKRYVIGSPEQAIATDVRQWVPPANTTSKNLVLRNTVAQIPGLPAGAGPGVFDRRAHAIWSFVAARVRYDHDKDRRGYGDFWLFAEETLSLGVGDCEDSSILLAALLVAADISPYVVRVALGHLYRGNTLLGSHAWVVYQDEGGVWRLLESTLDAVPPLLPAADALTRPGAPSLYLPDFCFNGDHLWWIRPPAPARPPRGLYDYMQQHLRNGIVHAEMTPALRRDLYAYGCRR